MLTTWSQLTSGVDVLLLIVGLLPGGVVEVDDVERDGPVAAPNRAHRHAAQEVLAWKTEKTGSFQKKQHFSSVSERGNV